MEGRGMSLICALDQGTTSTRAIMYEAATLRPVAVHQMEHTQHMPQAGCVACSRCVRARLTARS
jgi:glycerol kinase